MPVRPVLALVGVAAAAFVVAAFGSRALSGRGDVVPAAPAARTVFAGLSAATGEPTLPGLASLHPAPGTVGRAAGPFDDRLQLTGLSFDGSRVRGAARVTTDVSDLLELEVVAGFYDRHGRLLGTAGHVRHADEEAAAAHGHSGPPSETERFVIPVPKAYRGAAVAAAVGVPVLVNE